MHSAFPEVVMVRSQDKIRERLKMDDAFMINILEKGDVLYEAAVAWEDRRRFPYLVS